MCALCQKINDRLGTKVPLDEKETRQYLNEIAKAGPKKMNHFQKVMDKILGTEMTKSDPELDAAWEANRQDG